MIVYSSAIYIKGSFSARNRSYVFIGPNRKQSQELSVLSLHLLQNCLVYINTLLIQEKLSDPEHMKYMTEEDFRALTPLIYNHVNPYGSFNLDMNSRIPIVSEYKEAA